MKLRCSALPLAFLCPGSVREPTLKIDPHNEAGAVGTTVHRMLQAMVEGRNPMVADQSTEERILYYSGLKVWEQVSASFPDPVCEQPLECELVTPDGTEFELTGHPDVWSDAGNGLDWKTSRLDHNYGPQMYGYITVMLLLERRLPAASFTIAWLRTGDIERYSMTRDALPEFLTELYKVVDWDGTFRPGDHCTYCPRAHECPAREAMVRANVVAFTTAAEEPAELSKWTPERIVSSLALADHVAKVAAAFRVAVKNHVTRVGDVETDAHRITLDVSNKRHCDPLKAWEILEHSLTQEQLADAITVSLAKAEEAIRQNAPPRKGAQAIREFQAKLDDAGAVQLIPESRLVVKRR
jgi:hypothetical protein